MMTLATMAPPQGNPLLSKQIELETLHNKNQLHSRIRREFTDCKQFNFCEYIESKGLDCEFGLDVLVQMALHKRAKLPVMVGLLKHHFKGASACQDTANALLVAAEADLCDWNPVTEEFVIMFPLTDEVQRELDMYQFPLPMVTKPRQLRTNRDSPYVTVRDGSVILRNNHHDEDVCLDHLNRVNAYTFGINTEVARMIRNQWRNLDKPKEGETKQDFERRKRAFDKYDRTCKEVMQKVLELGNEFHLTHKYDKRGRVYCQGYHISYQAAPWNKAVIELADADKEIIP